MCCFCGKSFDRLPPRAGCTSLILAPFFVRAHNCPKAACSPLPTPFGESALLMSCWKKMNSLFLLYQITDWSCWSTFFTTVCISHFIFSTRVGIDSSRWKFATFDGFGNCENRRGSARDNWYTNTRVYPIERWEINRNYCVCNILVQLEYRYGTIYQLCFINL